MGGQAAGSSVGALRRFWWASVVVKDLGEALLLLGTTSCCVTQGFNIKGTTEQMNDDLFWSNLDHHSCREIKPNIWILTGTYRFVAME
jgi:hypothetical protein